LAAASLGFLGSDLFAALQSAAGLQWRWDRWPNVLWILPLIAVIGAARLSYGGPRSASPSPQSPIVRPLPTVTWALSFPVLHASLELAGWLAPAAHRPRELVVMATVAILGAYAVVQRQLLVRHSLELWRQGRRVERELKESEQDLLLMVARGHQRKSLERHEQTYQKAFQASPDALVLTTWSDGRILEVNQSFVDMLGTKREDVVGTLTRDLPLWRDASVRRRVLDRVMAEGPVHFAELRLRSIDGTRQRVALSLDRVETSEGRLLLAVFRRLDVRGTARDPGGDAPGWAMAFESAAFGLAGVDESGAVLFANEVAARRLGASPEALPGAPWPGTARPTSGARRLTAADGGFLELWTGRGG
ncbi:MAG: PAS domain S-box protein, partial [Acidobacteriota bacterium]